MTDDIIDIKAAKKRFASKKRSTGKGDQPKPRDTILELVAPWCGEDGEASFASIEGPHDSALHFRVGGAQFRTWVAGVLAEHELDPSDSAIRSVEAAVRGTALLANEQHRACQRTAWGADGALWLDLARPDNRGVRITPTGWKVAPLDERAPRFVRSGLSGALPLPVDPDGASLDALLAMHLNLPDESAGRRAAAWCVSAMRPEPPRWHLAIGGEQGGGKSSAARMLKRLVDPSAGNELASLRKQDDFAIAAAAQRCLVLDNISRVSGDYSDALARAATGGGEIARTLYTDSDVHSVRAEAAVIFTSIADVLHRPDLADRTLLLALEQPRARATDWAVWARFEGEWSLLLGALLDGLVGVLRYEGEVTAVLDMETAPRMIDPFIWTLAAGRAWGWPERQVIAQFADERRCLETDLLEGDPVFPLIAGFVRNNANGVFGDWEGTTAELFEGIRERLFMISKAEQVALPRSPRGLTSHLNRLAPPMRTAGWGVGRRWVGVGAASRHMWVIVPPSE